MTAPKGPYKRRSRGTHSGVAGVARSWRGGPGKSKYGAQPTVVDNFRFASKAEARRYQELLLLGMAREIRNLELQPRFTLAAGIVYVADFRYEERVTVRQQLEVGEHTISLGTVREWRDVVEDVKGMRTPVYVLKRKLFEAQYPQIHFREIP